MVDPTELGPDALRRRVQIVNRLGLHARAAAKLVTLAKRFESTIWVRKDARTASGKSIMGVMMLVAAQGAEIDLIAQGADAAAALDALAALVANRFDEEA